MPQPHPWPVTDTYGRPLGHLTLPAGPDDPDDETYLDQFNDNGTGEAIALDIHLTAEDDGTLTVQTWTGDADPAEVAALLRAIADQFAHPAPS